MSILFFFFFSSRRRHTRSDRDWSSDVCSSDLIQREQAEATAAKIAQFIKEIESQIGWTTQLPWSAGTLEQRRFDGPRLLRQVPAITELAPLDATRREQLRVSRLPMDVVGSQTDYSQDPKIVDALARKGQYRAG